MFLQPAGLKVQRVLCWGLCYRYSFKGLQRQPEVWLACTVTSASAHLPSVLWKVLFPTTIHQANLCMEAAVSWDCLGSCKVVGIPKGLVSFWCEDVKHPFAIQPRKRCLGLQPVRLGCIRFSKTTVWFRKKWQDNHLRGKETETSLLL